MIIMHKGKVITNRKQAEDDKPPLVGFYAYEIIGFLPTNLGPPMDEQIGEEPENDHYRSATRRTDKVDQREL